MVSVDRKELDKLLTKIKDHDKKRYNMIMKRVERGWSLEDAINVPKGSSRKVRDHTGREFNSEKEMCEFWGVKRTTFKSRLDSGATLKEALTRDKNSHSATEAMFNSKEEMLEYYGVDSETYDKRIEAGWSLMEALGLKERKN